MNKKINGRLTKRAIIRRMWLRAICGETSNVYNLKYVARRIRKTAVETRQIVRWMSDNHFILAEVVGVNVVFSF